MWGRRKPSLAGLEVCPPPFRNRSRSHVAPPQAPNFMLGVIAASASGAKGAESIGAIIASAGAKDGHVVV